MPRAADLRNQDRHCCRPGPTDSVLDVPGVGLGHATVWRDEADPPDGRGVARTGVTVLDPGGDSFRRPVPAGGAVLNGAGECTGFLTARRVGRWPRRRCSSPRRCRSAGSTTPPASCCSRRSRRSASRTSSSRVVAECDDSLPVRRPPDAGRRATTSRRRWRAARRSAGHATSPPDEGAVGAGTGMACLGLQGRHRYASRVAAVRPHRRRRCVLANFGERDRLTVAASRSAGCCRRRRTAGARRRPARASASSSPTRPLDAAGCARLARRVGLGLARTGSHRPPRQRRDLPRRSRPGCADRSRRCPRTATAGRRRATSTRSSRRSSRPPRRRCSTSLLDAPRRSSGRDGNTSRGPAVRRGRRAAGGARVPECSRRRGATTGSRCARRHPAAATALPARPRRAARSRACSRRCPIARTT